MARNIPVPALAKLAQATGLEPVNIIRVQWIKNGGYYYYADRNIPEHPNFQGKLVSMADLEAVLSIDKNTTSTTVQLVLDDTDNTIKSIFNLHDIHNRPVVIYQWFAEADFSINYMFPIFEGVVATPIEWDEGARTIRFDVMTSLEDREVGFSVEDGNFTDIPDILLGKSWPLVFGTVLDMPTVMMDEKPSGTTMVPLSIPDYSLRIHALHIDCAAARTAGKATCLSLRAAELMFMALGSGGGNEEALKLSASTKVADPVNITSTVGGFGARGMSSSAANTANRNANQNAASERGELQGLTTYQRDQYKRGIQIRCQSYQMMNSVNTKLVPKSNELKQKFEQQKKYDVNVIPIINGEKFRQGILIEIKINDALFTGTFQGRNFMVATKTAPKDEERDNDGELINNRFPQPAPPPGITITSDDCGSSGGNTSYFSEEGYWACEHPWHFTICEDPTKEDPVNKGDPWFAQAGAGVEVGANYPIRYILSITPGTSVLWLSARKNVNGFKVITPIPPSYYVVSTLVLGSVSALIATFSQPLSTREEEEWDDEVFATLQSGIGPNVVNIMIYLIQTYTQNTIDTVSFNHVRTLVNNYPANFALLDKKNVIELLSEIAFQSRCSIWVSGGKFYLKYLPEQGNSVDTITEDDIEQQTLKITTTPTEDLVTKFIATWRASYAYPDKNKVILTYNINKYGIRERAYDFYIYNSVELVRKSATFWLIRMANMWKKIQCRCVLTKLIAETMDNITVDLVHQSAAYVPVVGVVEKAAFNSEQYAIDMEIWLPVRIGEMLPYDFAYPHNIGVQLLFPTHDDIVGGFVNDNPQASNAIGNLSNGVSSSGNSGGSKSQSSPSDNADSPETNNIPPIITSTSEAAPYSQTTVSPANREDRPTRDYNLVPAKEPLAPRVLVVPDGIAIELTPKLFPGFIAEKISDEVYNGYIYPDGVLDVEEGDEENDGRKFIEEITVRGVDPEVELPNPTNGMILEQPEYDEDGELVYNYYYDPPIWR